jgi:hypothetical protein
MVAKLAWWLPGIAMVGEEDVVAPRPLVVLEGHFERVRNDHPKVTTVQGDREQCLEAFALLHTDEIS